MGINIGLGAGFPGVFLVDHGAQVGGTRGVAEFDGSGISGARAVVVRVACGGVGT
jgi:hypothetical protein